MVHVYHNPRCRKSREALAYLEEKGEEVIIREYLKNPPSRDELVEVLESLHMKPYDLIRRGEQEFKDHFLGKSLSDTDWIEAMLSFPKLIERPIVIKGAKAVVGRPKEAIDKVL